MVCRHLFPAAFPFRFLTSLTLNGQLPGRLSRQPPLSLERYSQKQSWWTISFGGWEWQIVWINGFVSLVMQRISSAGAWDRFRISPFTSCEQNRNQLGLLCRQHESNRREKQIFTKSLLNLFLIQVLLTGLEFSVALSSVDTFSWVTPHKHSWSLLTKISELLEGAEYANGEIRNTLKNAPSSTCTACRDTRWLQLKSYLWQLRLRQHISFHIKLSHSFGKGVNYFLCFNYFHGHSQLLTFHCLKGKWTLPNHFSSIQESLNWLITIDPLKDLDIYLLL